MTDVPIGAYVLAAAFDVISFAGQDNSWARDFYRAATFALIGGAAVSLLTALTGFWDWLRSTQPGTQARRAANAHALVMVTVTLLIVADLVVRLIYRDDSHTGVAVLVLSLVAVVLLVVGATLGGLLVFDYGFNVETAGDSPVWHPSETDVLPGARESADSEPSAASAG